MTEELNKNSLALEKIMKNLTIGVAGVDNMKNLIGVAGVDKMERETRAKSTTPEDELRQEFDQVISSVIDHAKSAAADVVDESTSRIAAVSAQAESSSKEILRAVHAITEASKTIPQQLHKASISLESAAIHAEKQSQRIEGLNSSILSLIEEIKKQNHLQSQTQKAMEKLNIKIEEKTGQMIEFNKAMTNMIRGDFYQSQQRMRKMIWYSTIFLGALTGTCVYLIFKLLNYSLS